MTNRTDQPEVRPSSVSAATAQDGEVLARWAWVEWSVWTPRMLTALDTSVKGNVWFSLIDKVFSERNLFAAGRKVFANGGAPGMDHVAVEAFEERLDENVAKLSEALRKDTYRWPNQFFHQHGLYSLSHAHQLACQSCPR